MRKYDLDGPALILAVGLFLFAGLTALAAGGEIHAPKRSAAQRAAFVSTHPCPANGHRTGACPGWVVDHVIALACGGADAPSNMQWQTVAEAKAKDRVELRCGKS
jgi:hypothetical protein